MTDNGKAFLEKISSDEVFRAELGNALKDAKGAEQIQLALDFAKKKGYPLTKEDFASDNEDVNLEELEAITGGGGCGCVLGGKGFSDGLKCSCFFPGVGFVQDDPRPSQGFCFCPAVGAGATRRH